MYIVKFRRNNKRTIHSFDTQQEAQEYKDLCDSQEDRDNVIMVDLDALTDKQKLNMMWRVFSKNIDQLDI